MATHPYKLTAQVVLPAFDTERRYVLTEKELANKQQDRLRGTWRSMFSYPSLGIYKRSDWQRYTHSLDDYQIQLDRYEKEIERGLIPFHIRVVHSGSQPDSDIKIQLMVGNGSIHLKQKPPKRPPRMDGAPDKASKEHFRWPTPGGFARRGVRITSRSVDVDFSKLEAHDDALLVNQVLYIACTDNTKMGFTISSRLLDGQQSGWVQMEG